MVGHQSIPANIRILLVEKEGRPYDPLMQRRSAYQAEFLRAWKKGEERKILAGIGHAPEIKHFLLHGVKEAEIVERAHAHAELLERDPQQYASLRNWLNMQTYFTTIAAGMTASLGWGLGTGLPVFAVAYYFMNH